MRTVVGWVLFLLAMVAIGVGVTAGAWSPAGPQFGYGMLRHVPCVSSPEGPSCGGLLPADPSLTDRLVLSNYVMTAGATLKAVLLVTNDSGEPIAIQRGPYCGPDFDVGLTNDRIWPNAGVFVNASCSGRGPLLVQPGTTRFSFPVFTTYGSCAQVPAQADVSEGDPACLDWTVSPPLPPGTYVAVLLGDQVELPPAVSAPLTIVASPTEAPRECRSPELQLSVAQVLESLISSQDGMFLAYTNVSDSSCFLDGYPTVDITAIHGTRMLSRVNHGGGILH